MAEYRVKWEVDVDASSPEQAARKALAMQRNPESIATVFEVTNRAPIECTCSHSVTLQPHETSCPVPAGGNPVTIDLGDERPFVVNCVSCGELIVGTAVVVFETEPAPPDWPHRPGRIRKFTPTKDRMCLECGKNGNNVRRIA